MLIIANWKAYVEDLKKAKSLFTVSKKLCLSTECSIVLAPSAPFIGALVLKNKSKIAFAAQDISATSGGAHTGENTAWAYAAAGVSYAIVGHSERRTAGDTNSIVAGKLANAIAGNLTPILCVGEHERDREGRYLAFIREAITSALSPLTRKDRIKIILAYEPLWAIGKTAKEAINPDDLAEMVLYIRKVLSEIIPGKSSSDMLILYGGSVEPGNIRDLALASHVDGFLIGHASVEENSFTALVRQLS